MYTYNALVTRVVDGDTLHLSVDLGFRITTHIIGRVYGIDTPETYGVKKDSEEYAKGKAATEFVEQWLAQSNNEVTIRTHKTGKYGRWLVEVLRGDESLSETLLEAGHAEPY